jgi:hypothetical protein
MGLVRKAVFPVTGGIAIPVSRRAAGDILGGRGVSCQSWHPLAAVSPCIVDLVPDDTRFAAEHEIVSGVSNSVARPEDLLRSSLVFRKPTLSVKPVQPHRRPFVCEDLFRIESWVLPS